MATRLSYSNLPVGKEAVMESRYDPLYGTEIAELQEELRQKKNRRYSAARKTTKGSHIFFRMLYHNLEQNSLECFI